MAKVATKWNVPVDTTVQVVEPMGTQEQKKEETSYNWHGICISLALISFVVMLIGIAWYILYPLDPPSFTGRVLQPKDLVDPTLRAAPLYSQWLSGFEVAFFSEESGLLIMNINKNISTQLISNLTLHQIGAVEFSISSNRFFVLLVHDVIEGRLYIRSSRYTIYDLRKNYYYPLKFNEKVLQHPRYQHVQWLRKYSLHSDQDPASSGSSELVVVHENNLYLLKEPKDHPRPLTTKGKDNQMYYGVPDAMYEEILRSSSSVWANLKGDHLAFLSFNDSFVRQSPLMKYEESPKMTLFRYASVESPIPQVCVWILNVKKDSRWCLIPPLPIANEEHYVLGVGWVNESNLWVSWVSRDQRTFLLAHCAGQNWTCSTVHLNHQGSGISPTVESVVWSESWAAFPWPVHVNEPMWHNRVAMIGLKGGYHPTLQLTGYHVSIILASNPIREEILFLGSEISRGLERQHLYSLSLKDESLQCHSCDINCPRITASLSPTSEYAVVTCVGIPIPSMLLLQLNVTSPSIPLHQQLILRNLMNNVALPIRIYRNIVLSPSLHASVDISVPPGWIKDDDSFLYPVVIHVKGIENYNDESNIQHRLSLAEILSSKNYFVHIKIRFWRNSQYVSTRTMASNIQKVIKILLSDYSFLDANQLSLWGWRSGASIALQLSTMRNPSFKCVIAINPVTDWRNYGSYWAERFLGSLNSVESGRRYEESNMLRDVTSFAPSLMLISSANDPISHHSSYLARELIRNNVYFQHMVYPDGTLALRKERNHVINCVRRFFISETCAIYHNYHL